jgi:hypothetical protein
MLTGCALALLVGHMIATTLVAVILAPIIAAISVWTLRGAVLREHRIRLALQERIDKAEASKRLSAIFGLPCSVCMSYGHEPITLMPQNVGDSGDTE